MKIKSKRSTVWIKENKSKVIAISCIGIAFILVYIIPSFLNRDVEEKIVYISSKNIKAGEKITEDIIDRIRVSSSDLPKSFFLSEEDIVGKYAISNINNQDLINDRNISDKPLFENDYLTSLGNGKQAISVSIKSLAKGLSNKLESGDIISINSS